jgi:hypothetical protein
MWQSADEYRNSSFDNSSFVPEERAEGSVLLDFFVTFLIKQESLKCKIRYISVGCPSVEVRSIRFFLYAVSSNQ